MFNHPKIYRTNQIFFEKILDYYNISYKKNIGQYTLPGFDQYNHLVRINQIFSTAPSGDIVDRCQLTPMPYQMTVVRPWEIPTVSMSLEQAFQTRIQTLENHSDKINILWSGGIDSTAILVAMLQHGDLTRYRILYTKKSIVEHASFYLKLIATPNLEIIDFSGEIYLNQQLDGIFVTGAGGDGIMASLDESFFNVQRLHGLKQPWQDLFWEKEPNIEFLNFCTEFASRAGRPIVTVLDFRWWFYTCCKLQKFPAVASDIVNDDQPLALGFYDSKEFEDHMYFNLDTLITKDQYSSYKQTLKDYIFAYDRDVNYYRYKAKENSWQITHYQRKKLALKSTNYIMMLDNGQRIRTPNLPFVSEKDYRNTYSTELDYLFYK